MGKPKLPTKTPNKNITLNKTINKRGDKIKKRSIQQFSKFNKENKLLSSLKIIQQ
jgi:hypothetical protein